MNVLERERSSRSGVGSGSGVPGMVMGLGVRIVMAWVIRLRQLGTPKVGEEPWCGFQEMGAWRGMVRLSCFRILDLRCPIRLLPIFR